MSTQESIYGFVAEFDQPDALVEAARQVRAEGYRDLEAYTPFSIEALDELIVARPTRLPWIIFLAGLAGCAGAFGMQYFASVIHYPLNVGGRPLNSWPAFIPVTFELTVLTAALVGVIAMLASNGLPQFYHPVFDVPGFDRASRDRFFLAIHASDPKFDRLATREFLLRLKPLNVVQVWAQEPPPGDRP